MFKTIISSKKYWISVCFIGLAFIFVFSIVEHFMQYGGLVWEQFLEQKINYGQWKKYLVSRLAGGLIYGMIMAYYFQYKKRKH